MTVPRERTSVTGVKGEPSRRAWRNLQTSLSPGCPCCWRYDTLHARSVATMHYTPRWSPVAPMRSSGKRAQTALVAGARRPHAQPRPRKYIWAHRPRSRRTHCVPGEVSWRTLGRRLLLERPAGILTLPLTALALCGFTFVALGTSGSAHMLAGTAGQTQRTVAASPAISAGSLTRCR